ncbi:MAG: carboxypeptidase-like regulatory domain-containing protein, partial [Candidatus ainarchaeum sp.]|nr:carboxypeptidase-like regulatory domain-containing protein [Candidatus ainarchaeum sp.]
MVDLKEIYFGLEDKWYALVDRVSDKLPFVGKAVDKLEEKGIPSFPTAIILLIIILFLIYFLLIGTGQTMIIGVYDAQNNPVELAKVSVFSNGSIIVDRYTNERGQANFFLEDKEYTIKIDKEGFNSITRDFVKPKGTEEKFGLTLEDVLITKAVSL